MSDYGEEIIDRLHPDCSLRDEDNPIRKVIDYGVGEWFDNFDDPDFLDKFFLDTSVDGYLDKWGRDYNVPRKPDESDDDYRKRIVYEALGYLTIPYLLNVYGLTLYWFVENFDVRENILTSDNQYIPGVKMAVMSNNVFSVLDKKFVLNQSILKLSDDNILDYYLDVNGNFNDFNRFLDFYSETDLYLYFINYYNPNIFKKVSLNHDTVLNASGLFAECGYLEKAIVSVPNAVNVEAIFAESTQLTNVKLIAPSIDDSIGGYMGILSDCPIVNVDLTVPEDLKNDIINDVLNTADTTNLTSFIVNGEEVNLT